jgi:hypothetical protein
MTSTIVSVALALAMGTAAQQMPQGRGRWVLPPGRGYGYGFPNGAQDGYGWYDIQHFLPLSADRTGEYYFRSYFAVPVDEMFFPTYYNPYVTRGQRYIAYTGCGGDHPAGGPPIASAATPIHPYQDTIGTGPRVQLPSFSGRVEAPPVNSGGTGLTP